MKKNYEILQKLIEAGLDIDMFYTITVTSYNIKLQGDITTRNVNVLEDMFGIKFEYVNEHQWLLYKASANDEYKGISLEGLDITLTMQ